MEVYARARKIRISAQKMRPIADRVRGKHIAEALEFLSFCNNAGALPIKKALESAIANAENNHDADIDELRVTRIFIDKGRTMKRMRPRAKGRMDRIFKRTSHITVAVADD